MTAATASAELVKLQADLKGGNEVPPNNSPGTGKAEATYESLPKSAPIANATASVGQ